MLLFFIGKTKAPGKSIAFEDALWRVKLQDFSGHAPFRSQSFSPELVMLTEACFNQGW